MKIALVLGSGGARGYAHIGVIEELESRGHEIVALSGASMGALIGGVYAAGQLSAYADVVRDLTRTQVLRYTDFTVSGPGFSRAKRIVELLEGIVGDVRIEDLPIPFTAVATDLERRREVWFREGLLVPAIRASISIPTVFTPVRIDGRLLVDGGVLNPLPMEPALQAQADATIGVSLLGRDFGVGRSSPDHGAVPKSTSWRSQFAASLRSSFSAPGLSLDQLGLTREQRSRARHDASEIAGAFEELPAGLTSLDMLSRALDVMQAQIEAGRTAMNRPDVLISVPADTCGVLDFADGKRVIEIGRTLAREAFDRVGL